MPSENDRTAYEVALRKCVRLRRVGMTILVMGLVIAALVYWLGSRSAEPTDNLAMVGYNRAQSQQMGVLFGKSGLVIDDLFASLKRPEVQARWIAGLSIVIALICFYLGRPLDEVEPVSGSDQSLN
jgi:hypothetical protein